MMWREVQLSDLGRIVTGKTPATKQLQYYGGEFLFVTPTDLNFRHYYCRDTHSMVTTLARDAHANQFIPPDSVMFTCIGNTIGKCGISSEYCLTNQQINSIIPNSEVDSLFLYYLLENERGRIRGIGLGSGAAQPIINKSTFSKLWVSIPELPVQQAIVDILRQYDDLIENNRRRIQLLEESARLLYREWFVHLRFPGHEHVKVVDGVPEEWESKTADELCHVFRGRSYRSSELVESGGQNFINLKCVDRGGGFRSEGIKRFLGDHKKTHVAGPGSIVLAVTDMTRDRLVIGEAARVPSTVSDDAVISMDLVRVAPFAWVEGEWFYFMLRYSTFGAEVKEKASGTNVLHLNPRHVQEQKVILPAQNLRREFSDTVRPILQQLDCLRAANEKLSLARDLLLPRLMNGEIAV